VPFRPSKKSVVHQPRFIYSIGVDDEGADERAQIDQMVPVATVARESGCLDAEDGTDAARAHARDEPLEPRTLHQP
jgi:hypothetical protein